MTKRMQVLIDDQAYRGIRRTGGEWRVAVADSVRQFLREARMAKQSAVAAKLRGVDEAARHRFPVGDIETMLREIDADRLPE